MRSAQRACRRPVRRREPRDPQGVHQVPVAVLGDSPGRLEQLRHEALRVARRRCGRPPRGCGPGRTRRAARAPRAAGPPRPGRARPAPISSAGRATPCRSICSPSAVRPAATSASAAATSRSAGSEAASQSRVAQSAPSPARCSSAASSGKRGGGPVRRPRRAGRAPRRCGPRRAVVRDAGRRRRSPCRAVASSGSRAGGRGLAPRRLRRTARRAGYGDPGRRARGGRHGRWRSTAGDGAGRPRRPSPRRTGHCPGYGAWALLGTAGRRVRAAAGGSDSGPGRPRRLVGGTGAAPGVGLRRRRAGLRHAPRA